MLVRCIVTLNPAPSYFSEKNSEICITTIFITDLDSSKTHYSERITLAAARGNKREEKKLYRTVMMTKSNLCPIFWRESDEMHSKHLISILVICLCLPVTSQFSQVPPFTRVSHTVYASNSIHIPSLPPLPPPLSLPHPFSSSTSVSI